MPKFLVKYGKQKRKKTHNKKLQNTGKEEKKLTEIKSSEKTKKQTLQMSLRSTILFSALKGFNR